MRADVMSAQLLTTHRSLTYKAKQLLTVTHLKLSINEHRLCNHASSLQQYMPARHRVLTRAGSQTLLSPAECQACNSCSSAFILPQFMLLETCSQLFSSVSPAQCIHPVSPLPLPLLPQRRHGPVH